MTKLKLRFLFKSKIEGTSGSFSFQWILLPRFAAVYLDQDFPAAANAAFMN